MSKSLSIVGSSRKNGERDALDFYPTPEYATLALLNHEKFNGNILEPACGDGAISKVCESYGFQTYSSDIISRGFGAQADFFELTQGYDNIITNPPYSCALKFVLQSKRIARAKIAMFLKTVFLEGSNRYEMFNDRTFPLKKVLQFSSRVTLYKGGVRLKNSGMISYAWFIWDREYYGEPTIQWLKEKARAKAQLTTQGLVAPVASATSDPNCENK